jgi:hypothetical protein
MRTIQETFQKGGWAFRRIKRHGNWAIFERTALRDNAKPHYEVVRIRSHNGFKIPGTAETSKPSEFYPSDAAWGRDGFTFLTIQQAQNRFEEVSQ